MIFTQLYSTRMPCLLSTYLSSLCYSHITTRTYEYGRDWTTYSKIRDSEYNM